MTDELAAIANATGGSVERRGRPKKKPRNTPETRPFDEIAAGIAAIAKEGGAWYRAKEAAQAIIAADKDLSLQPSCMRLFRAMVEQLNHDVGFDITGRDHYASLCGMHTTTYSRAMRYLRRHGYALRRQVPRPGAYDLWETTLPVVLAGHAVAERVAEKSNSGSRIFEFPVQGGQPNGYTIPIAAVAAGEGESATPTFKSEGSTLVRGEGVLSFLSDQHFARFHQVDAQWGGAARPADQIGRYLHDLVVQACKEATVEDVERALVLTLAVCEEEAARPSNKGKRGRFANFFSKAFDGQLHERKKTRLEREEELRHVPELEAAKHEADLKTLTAHTAAEEQIAQRRPAEFEKAAAANRAKPRPRSTSSGSRYVVADGRQIFADDAKIMNIGFQSMFGTWGNKILRAVPMATVEDVEDILLDLSVEFSGTKKDVPLGKIMDTAIRRLEVRLAYAKYGTPEQLCGGSPALKSEWVAVSEELVATIKKACPLLYRDDREQAWTQVVVFAESHRGQYGLGLQQAAEAKFKELMEQRQQVAAQLEQEEARKEEAAERARQERKAELLRNVEAEARALYGQSWDALPASEKELALAKAATSLCDSSLMYSSSWLGDAKRREADDDYRRAEQQAFRSYIGRDRGLTHWFSLNQDSRLNLITQHLVAEHLAKL